MGIRIEQALLNSGADRKGPGVLIHDVDVKIDGFGEGFLGYRRHDHDRTGARAGADPGGAHRVVVLLYLVHLIGVFVVELIGLLPVGIVAVAGRRTRPPEQA